jgi:hypothetical protein
MQLRMWTYDIAREQNADLGTLRRFCDLTQESGYNAIGLYLEHRFAYPSTPWSHGRGVVTPEMVRALQEAYPDLQIIPFVNLLGHFEGMLYTEEGRKFAEEKFKGMQADPTNEEFVALAGQIVDDTLSIFTSEVVHIGGDETWQLGVGERSKARVAQYEAEGEGIDGKARLYGAHFAPLAQRVADAGRRPGVWGDMFFDHPQALEMMPKNTIIFDWQYFRSPEFTSQRFFEAGHDVVLSPALHTYNATWMHLPQSEQNVRDHVDAAQRLGAYGVCVTTWELGLFGNYETLMPALKACGKMLAQPQAAEDSPRTDPGYPHIGQGGPDAVAAYAAVTDAPDFLRAYLAESELHEEWARLMGVELQTVGGTFAFGGIRSSLKVRLLLYSNPFLAWLYHADELSGEVGTKALDIFERAIAVGPDPSYRGVAQFGKSAVQFVQFAEKAHLAYAKGSPGEAITHLSPCRQIFDDLSKVARSTNLRVGGSLADIERCRVAKEHVERVIRRIKEFGDGSLGYLPSFETITHPKFMPHDQANWWLINRWANE